jgi:hypothetical protein
MSVPLARRKYKINCETITQEADTSFFPASGWLHSYSLKRTVIKYQIFLTCMKKFSTADIQCTKQS